MLKYFNPFSFFLNTSSGLHGIQRPEIHVVKVHYKYIYYYQLLSQNNRLSDHQTAMHFYESRKRAHPKPFLFSRARFLDRGTETEGTPGVEYRSMYFVLADAPSQYIFKKPAAWMPLYINFFLYNLYFFKIWPMIIIF